MIKGFILSAGFSTRLRPITEHIPKPLLPVAGEVMIDYIYNFLKSAGVKQVGINLHYKADEIEKHIVEHNLDLKIFHEKKILDTAGAIYNARNFLNESVFIVHNGDIYWDGNIKDAIEEHIKSKNIVTLLVHDCPPYNKLVVDEEGNLEGIEKYEGIKSHASTIHPKSSNKSVFAFTGVAIYSPEILSFLPEGASSVVDLWLNVVKRGVKVKCFISTYSFWHDIGTPISYARAIFDKLKRNFSSLYIALDSSGCELIEPCGYVVIEKDARIKKSFKGKNIIVLPYTEVEAHAEEVSDCIIFKDLVVSIAGWQMQKEALASGGSTRSYFRVKDMVICEWDKVSDEFEKTVYYGKFFKNKGFSVPQILHVDKDKNLIIFEDLGDLTLYSWLQCKRKKEEIVNIYKQILEDVLILHWEISSYLAELEIPLPEFNYEYFRWESNYFLNECVYGVFNVDLNIFGNIFNQNGLQQELNWIAERLSKARNVILHRDLQSQNIILKNNKVYFVDYQSARLGPPAYDLASLLWDPYVYLEEEIRQELVNFYVNKVYNFHSSDLSFQTDIFVEELCFCRIQRHMQALGAYGFLSMKRGKKNFIKFIPSALDLLKKDMENAPVEFPFLKKLVTELINKKNTIFYLLNR